MIAATDPFMRTRVPIPDHVELRGPADADHFRVKVGRYGDRWYHDPLEADTIAGVCDEVFPSVSTVKKASGNDWSFVALGRVATALDTDTYRKLAQWPHADRYEALKAINKNGLNRAAMRGTNVHLMFEAHLYGQPCPISESDPGYEYRSAVEQFFDHYQPTLIAAEVVCINRTLNGVGYGGTSDCFLSINGGVWNVDWKSRGVDSEHGAYPEEAAQVSAGARADYLIVEGDNGPERRLLPELAGGLIVSVKPDGCRVYPIDLAQGFQHWTALHAWWCARRDERKAIGRQWAPRKNAPVEVVACRDADTVAVGMVEAPAGLPIPAVPESAKAIRLPAPDSGTPSQDVGDTGGMTAIAQVFPVSAQLGAEWDEHAKIEREVLATLNEAVVEAIRRDDAPSQGADLSDPEFELLWAKIRHEHDALPAGQREWVNRLSREAMQANVSFHTRTVQTERSYHICKALVTLAAGGADDEILEVLLIQTFNPIRRPKTLGHWVGLLHAIDALTLATLADQWAAPPPTAA